MNVLSLFDGIGCGMLALQRSNIKVHNYFASEIDKYAVQVAHKNFPSIIHIGDVEKINYSEKLGIDLLIGGSPCQGFSVAGKQLNFKDQRSKLFFEYVRILNECKPKYFLFENVKMKKEYQDIISSYLGVQPIEINSNLVTAQTRARLYWTNIPIANKPKNKNIKLKDIIEGGYVDREKSYCIDANYYKGGNLKSYFEKRRRQLVFIEKDSTSQYRKLTPIECERLQTLPDNYTEGISNTQRYKCIGNGWTVDVIAHIFKGLKEAEHE